MAKKKSVRPAKVDPVGPAPDDAGPPGEASFVVEKTTTTEVSIQDGTNPPKTVTIARQTTTRGKIALTTPGEVALADAAQLAAADPAGGSKARVISHVMMAADPARATRYQALPYKDDAAVELTGRIIRLLKVREPLGVDAILEELAKAAADPPLTKVQVRETCNFLRHEPARLIKSGQGAAVVFEPVERRVYPVLEARASTADEVAEAASMGKDQALAELESLKGLGLAAEAGPVV